MARDFWTNPYPWPTVDPTTGTQTIYNDTTVTRLTDDVVMTNVVGFDVKAWDPGAPVLQYNSMLVMPGDPYYATALSNVTSTSTNPSIAYYGAYVDLGWDQNSTSVSATPSTTSSYAVKRPKGAPLPYFDHLGQGYVVGSNGTTYPSCNLNTYLSRSALSATNPTNNYPVPAYNFARVYDTYSLHYEYDGLGQPTPTGVGKNAVLPNTPDIGTNGADDNDAITSSQINGADDPGEAETCPPYPVPLRGIQVKIRSMDSDSGQVREVTVVQEFLPQ
jgi:hypothetical protein